MRHVEIGVLGVDEDVGLEVLAADCEGADEVCDMRDGIAGRVGDDDVKGAEGGRSIGGVEIQRLWSEPGTERPVVCDGVDEEHGICCYQHAEDDGSGQHEEHKLPGRGADG